MKFILYTFIVIILIYQLHASNDDNTQCSIESRENCEDADKNEATKDEENRYSTTSNMIYLKIKKALENYVPCTNETDDPNCQCHAHNIDKDLSTYMERGITRLTIETTAKYGTFYKIYNHHLYRESDCMFPARCSGIEHFILPLLPELSDMDLIINTRDWPQSPNTYSLRGPVFSFSKTDDYDDIMYPAWSFWAGGPAISLFPTGIGRWDILRDKITKAGEQYPWMKKENKAFFRGSRTSDERDSLILLSRRNFDLVDAQYTKNQAWKSSKDTLHAEPAAEVSFEEHCRYKYLFNFRGVAASFRFKHLFLCKSLVFHVGDEFQEFFYDSLKAWVHYVPLKSYPSEEEIETLLKFFMSHEDLAQKIAQSGFDFIQNHLRMQDVQCYWKTLLTRYQKLLRYKVTKDNKLIEIEAETQKAKTKTKNKRTN